MGEGVHYLQIGKWTLHGHASVRACLPAIRAAAFVGAVPAMLLYAILYRESASLWVVGPLCAGFWALGAMAFLAAGRAVGWIAPAIERTASFLFGLTGCALVALAVGTAQRLGAF